MRRSIRLLAVAAVLAAGPAFTASAVLAGPFGLSAEQLATLAPQLDMLRSCPPEDEWRGFAGIDCPATVVGGIEQSAED